jgi:hypothetical protein
MSKVGKARIAVKQAIGVLGKVNKIQGQLVILRGEAKGRARDWASKVKRAFNGLLGLSDDWGIISETPQRIIYGRTPKKKEEV